MFRTLSPFTFALRPGHSRVALGYDFSMARHGKVGASRVRSEDCLRGCFSHQICDRLDSKCGMLFAADHFAG
jgi:hypothetical protein